MSDHSTALVPIETWAYGSLDLRANSVSIDKGLLAEALLYYDHVVVNVTTQSQFAAMLGWFLEQGEFDTLIRLIEDDTLRIYDYAFSTTAIRVPDGSYALMNVQDNLQKEPNTFERRVLYHDAVSEVLSGSQRRRLYGVLRDRVIEVKAADYETGVFAAREDLWNPDRCNLILQAFVDSLYDFTRTRPVPRINVQIHQQGEGRRTIDWGIRFEDLRRMAGKEVNFHDGSPLTAAAVSNRFLWSAASMDCDLYVPSPMGALVGDKLWESYSKTDHTAGLIGELVERVEFPDIHALVNQDRIPLSAVLEIRKRGNRFRTWLQDEADRDRDAIIAYHQEVATESGFDNIDRKTLKLFGLLGGSAVGAAVGAAFGPDQALVGALANGAASAALTSLVTDLVAKLGAGWKPVVFGDWMKGRVIDPES